MVSATAHSGQKWSQCTDHSAVHSFAVFDPIAVEGLSAVSAGFGARLWTYMRDDRPFAGPDPLAAVFFYSPDRGGAHPEQHLAGYAGLMQALDLRRVR